MKNGGTAGHRLDRWLDEWKMALSGIVLATRERKFLVVVLLSFVFFGTLMNLLAGSTAALNLFWATDFTGKLTILKDGFLGLFGINQNFWDWLLIFSITLLQSILIGLVVLVWQKRRRSRQAQQVASAKNSDNLQNVGLVAGLAVLGSGCPTCGTTLLAPVLGAIFSSSSYALAGTISGLLTLAAALLALFTLKRIGKDAYVMITSEKFQHRQQSQTQKEVSSHHAESTKHE